MSRSGLPIYFSFFYSHYHCVSFCMVVPNGKTHCLYSETLSSTNVSPCNPTNMSLNEYTRGRQISRQISRSSCASNKSFRSKSSVGYAERMETQSWANQMDVKDSIVKPQMESAQEAMIVPVPTQETSNVPVHEDTSCSTTNINVPLLSIRRKLQTPPHPLFRVVQMPWPTQTFGTATSLLYTFLG